MKAHRHTFPAALLLALLCAGFSPAQDIIKLKNGNRFRGVIRNDSGDMIRVEIKAGMIMTFPKSDVAEIIRGKHPPPPPKPAPQPKKEEPEPEVPTLASVQRTVARLIYDGKFTEAEECCKRAQNAPRLQDGKAQIAALRKDAQQVAAIWQKVKTAIRPMKGKEVLFRDGIGAPMIAVVGNRIVAQAGQNRPIHELDPALALSLANVTDPAARGIFFFYARKWDAANKELQAAAGAGADVTGYVLRINEALAQAAGKERERAKSVEKRQERRKDLASRHKATAQVLKLTRRGQNARDDRKFQEALQALQEARNIAAQSLPPYRTKKIDQEIQEVVETARVLLDIEIREVYVPAAQMDYGVQMEKKETRERGERWSREKREEVVARYHGSLVQQIGDQIAMSVSQSLQAFGYMVVHPNQLKRGDRSSVLKISYREYSILGATSPWGPPIPGPVWPVYGVALHIECKLELLDPFGRDVWNDEISLTTPLSTGDGSLISQGGRSLFLQQLQMLTFRSEED